MPVPAGVSDFEQLTRRHAVKLVPSGNCSVEEAALAVGKEIGYNNVKSASRMNGAIVIFLSSTEKVAEAVEKGADIQGTYTPVLPLVSPTKRIIISNAPPFIRNDILVKELSCFGQVVSPIKMLSLGCKSPLLKHVICHRRQTLMVLRDNESDLNVSFSFKIDGFNYMVFATSETMKCFGCGAEGHLIRACPERVDGNAPVRNYAQAAAPAAASADPSVAEQVTEAEVDDPDVVAAPSVEPTDAPSGPPPAVAGSSTDLSIDVDLSLSLSPSLLPAPNPPDAVKPPEIP